MTDIMRKLELLANIKSPCESYGYDVVASTCVEALAEIRALRDQQATMLRNAGEMHATVIRPVASGEMNWRQHDGAENVSRVQSYNGPLRPPTDEPIAEPWGSSYAMDPRNWK